jgi:hypothetical protein
MSLTEVAIIAGFRKAHCLPISGSQADNPLDTVASVTDWGSICGFSERKTSQPTSSTPLTTSKRE